MKLHNTIFSTKELNSKAKAAFPNGILDFEEKLKKIENWQENIYSGKITSLNEEELKPLFLSLFFGEILDYDLQNPNVWNLYLESKTSFDTTKADAALGFFSLNEKQEIEKDIRAVVEIKNARTTLDKPQFRADFKGSAVEQCFMYAAKSGENCKWVVVSNFLEIRLYLSSDMNKYEYFDVLELNEPDEFYRFYFLLAKNQLFNEKKSSQVDVLLEKRLEKERNITFEFYEHYKYLREVFLQHLKLHNPQKNPLDLLQYAQTVIDRIVFVCVIKDYDFIQYNVLNEIVDISQKSWASDKLELWRQIKYFFKALDDGLPNRIHRLNGGLFKYNEKIDELIIKDVFLKQLLKLTNYDFESDLNINILGHIFEQSITDIENLKKEITENKKIEYSETDDEINYKTNAIETNKRKKEGIFYTPENITHYIVKYTIGSWLEEQKTQIGLNDLIEFPKTEIEKKKHIERWEKYIEVLKNIKILDPACGSGAFLTQAFDFLLKEWTMVFDVVDKLKENIKSKKSKDLFETAPTKLQHSITKIKKEIVNNNLFGVDLNFESVEITKLGLWLKSASKVEALAILDSNIKCGNSLISDKNITEKAFVWEEEFPEILSQGGFDIIVGNPPYVESKKLKEFSDYFSKNYKCYSGTSDLYVYFFELGFNMLKEKGMLGFINSNKFMKTSYGENLRAFISKKKILQIIDFTDYRVFEDALVASCIMIICNQNSSENIKVSFVNQSLKNYEKIEDYVVENHFYMESTNLDEQIWFLSANGRIPIKHKIEHNSIKLKDIEGINIYRGITTGYNEAFIIDDETRNRLIQEDKKNAEIIKPLLQGRNIRKWFYKKSNLFMLLTGYSVNIPEEYPKVFKHIKQYEIPLSERVDKGKNWWNLRACKYYNEFEKPKIIWGLTADKWAFCFDSQGHYLPSNGYILTSDSQLSLEYILGVLNSKLMRFYFDFIGIMTAGGAFTLKYDTISDFPFKLASPEIQTQISKYVSSVIELHQRIETKKEKFIYRILINFENLKDTQKIQDFYKISFKEFLEEFKRQKIKIQIKSQTELEEYFNENKNLIISDIEKANSLENQINLMVYKLYNLTDSEIEIIEKIINY
ncbi:MAG TPA: Eco57I restriction-modification methylase domain-containing protein [Candidatus Kapabacteria bacterium]|nr:Eco57I restriction-modification methylase domain-containing protein [Candidatus Kapabacteria bacterium]